MSVYPTSVPPSFPVASAAHGSERWRAAGASDAGRVRTNNEDRFFCDAERGLYIVVDGVGGHNAGEVAAGLALEVILKRLERRTGSAEERLREAVALANNEIYRAAAAEAAHAGMAAVLTVALVEHDVVTAGHVGDTRLYRVDAAGLEKLTHDHSPIGLREDAGELSEAEAMQHPRRNEIYRDVGTAPRDPDDPDFIEIVRAPCPPDAALLLCSDGLTDLVPSADILETFRTHAGDPAATAAALIERANAAGGKDNVTVVVAEGPRFAGSLAAAVHAPHPSPAYPAYPAYPADHTDTTGAVMPRARYGRAALLFLAGLVAGVLLLTLLQGLLTARLETTAPDTLPLVVAPDGRAPYGSIAAALVAARPGDVVRVAPGSYRERLVVPDSVRLEASSPRAVRLQPPDAGDAALVVVSDAAQLAGFALEGTGTPGEVGIHIVGRTALVEDVEVAGMGGAGVVVDSLSRATLRGSLLRENVGAAVAVHPLARPRIVHNVLLQNGGAGAPYPGILITAGTSAFIADNVFGDAPGNNTVTAPSRTDTSAQRNFFNSNR